VTKTLESRLGHVPRTERGDPEGREDSTVEITEVRIKLVEDAQERLQAFCSITIDGCFVVRDLKIINGTKGPFVAMPSRKLTDRCAQCGGKNCLRAAFCNQCGRKLSGDRAEKGLDGRAKLYADIAHPINSECRETIQSKVLSSFEQEIVLARQPGYVCRYDDFGEEAELDSGERWEAVAAAEEAAPVAPAAGAERDPRRRIEPAERQPSQPPHTPAAGRPEHAAAPRHAAKPAAGWVDGDDFGEGIV
jgi:stage V sporulation protein G